ncbi:Rap1a/Tai family immunity protein [Legionella pneumophila serogroup 1]
MKIKLPIFSILLLIPLCTYSWDSLYLLENCKEHINFKELAKIKNEATSLDDPIIKFANNGNLCSGYIHGFLDAHSFYIQEKKYCIPDPIDTYQIAKVYSKYLDEHPEKLHQSSSFTFSEALIEYFPCKN